MNKWWLASFRRLGGQGPARSRRLTVSLVSVLAMLGYIHYAQAPSTEAVSSARHYVLLVDQSGSVVNAGAVRSLAQQAAVSVLGHLQATAGADDAVQVIFFGARAITVITPTSLLDISLAQRLQAALTDSRSLGSTSVAETLHDLLQEAETSTDVILITDGAPDTAETGTRPGQIAYAERLRQLARTYAEREITLSLVLIGPHSPTDWQTVWREVATAADGVVVEIHSPEEASLALIRLATSLAPTATPTSPPTPSVTSSPSVAISFRPTPVSSPTPMRVLTEPIARRLQISSVAWLSLIGLGALVGLVALCRARKLHLKPRNQNTIGDEGILEICDTQTGDIQRVELLGLAPDQIWSLCCGPQSYIRLRPEEGETREAYAVLCLTPDGLQIEGRDEAVWFEGRLERKHRLFDGDQVQVGHYALTYQNFFRRRGETRVEEEIRGEQNLRSS